MKVLSVVGNRPQFIKSAPLSLALRAAGIDEVVLHSGQHYDAEMSQVFFDELGLAAPAYRLDLHSADPAAMQPGIRAAIERERPDWTLVYGDTNTTAAGERAGEGRAWRLPARDDPSRGERPAGEARPDRRRPEPPRRARRLSRSSADRVSRIGSRAPHRARPAARLPRVPLAGHAGPGHPH